MAHGAFSQPGPWRPAVGARLARTLGAVLHSLRSACPNSRFALLGDCQVWRHRYPTKACHRLAAETGEHCWCASQNCACTTAVGRGLVHAHTPANALPCSRAGAASEPAQFTALAASSLGLRLTLRSSGPPTACRLGRAAVLFIIVHAAKAPRRRRPLNSHVRPHTTCVAL